MIACNHDVMGEWQRYPGELADLALRLGAVFGPAS
jgi:hypothetical protein